MLGHIRSMMKTPNYTYQPLTIFETTRSNKPAKKYMSTPPRPFSVEPVTSMPARSKIVPKGQMQYFDINQAARAMSTPRPVPRATPSSTMFTRKVVTGQQYNPFLNAPLKTYEQWDMGNPTPDSVGEVQSRFNAYQRYAQQWKQVNRGDELSISSAILQAKKIRDSQISILRSGAVPSKQPTKADREKLLQQDLERRNAELKQKQMAESVAREKAAAEAAKRAKDEEQRQAALRAAETERLRQEAIAKAAADAARKKAAAEKAAKEKAEEEAKAAAAAAAQKKPVSTPRPSVPTMPSLPSFNRPSFNRPSFSMPGFGGLTPRQKVEKIAHQREHTMMRMRQGAQMNMDEVTKQVPVDPNATSPQMQIAPPEASLQGFARTRESMKRLLS